MTDYTTYKAAYDRDGFALVRGFLPPDELGTLTDHVARYIRDIVPTLPDQAAFYQDKGRPETLKQLQRMGEYDPFFNDYRHQPRWCDLAQTLIGETAEAGQPEWFNKPPNTQHPTPPHQDNFYFNLTPPNVASVWVAIDPVDDDNGCLRYAPGSHRGGIRGHQRTAVLGFSQGLADYGEEERAGEVAVHMQPGDAVVHHGEVIHRADPNHSDKRHRQAFAMVFEGVSCRVDEAGRRRYQESVNSQHQGMGLETSE
ncbi:MAG: phytanoyl-CoA dioxygenase family protein [Candidatus Latescibacteria bacterium]|nr:phytanoyl-CoA dioxygenase family protein [Candidatus Latescibacterota bacterium]